MAFKLANRAFVLTATTGTGSISLGSVVAGYQSFSAAGITDGDTVRYTIEDGTNWEIGTGTLSNSVGTMARSVIDSSGGGSALTLSGNAKVFLTAAADDILVEVVEDTSPQLGGNLDVQTREITTSTSNGNVKITPNGSGVVEVKGAGGNDGTLQLNCSANSHGVKIKSPPHSAGATYTLTLPNDDGSSGQSLISDGSGNLSFTTITSNATHTGEVTGSGALTIADNIVDEANLKVSNSPTNGYFLSAQSGNTGGLTWAAAGAELYAANPSSATDPTASGNNALAIGDNATASNTDAIAIGSDATASNTETVAIGHNAIATNSLSIAIGHDTKTIGIAGTSLNVLNTNSSYGASGIYGIALGYNSAADNYGSIAIGPSSTSQSQYAVAIGDGAAVYTSNATYAYALGRGVDVRGENAFGLGKFTKIPTTKGKYAYSAGGGYSAQTGTFVLRSDTTNATAEALTTNNSTAAADNQITPPDNSAYAFHGTIVAREKASEGTECAAWKVEGLIRREGSAGTTVLVNSATTVLANTPNWGMALSADTTNGCLKIAVTGAASTNIYWAATINTSEVTYA